MSANIQTIENDWVTKWEALFTSNVNIVRLISPFINCHMVDRLIAKKGNRQVQVITRYNLNDFFAKASDIEALEKLIANGIGVKGIKDLHSKVYIFDNESVIIASANFTFGGFMRNKEFGIVSDSQQVVLNSISYFQSLWNCTDTLLTQSRIEEFKKELDEISKKPKQITLKDHGVCPMKKALGGERYFVKFYGTGNERISPKKDVQDQISDTHCHFALTYPNDKRGARPRQIKDGDVVFIARMVEGGGYAIFGKAIARKHNNNRDFASPEDILQKSWKKKYPVYIRVHSGEFINTKLSECPDMKRLMKLFKEYSFRSTKEKADNPNWTKEINPNLSLAQKAHIELSEESASWLLNEFESAKKKYGLVPQNYIDSLYAGTPKI